MYKLLLVDDDIETLSINKKFLEKEKYQVQIASSAKAALKLLSSFQPDCIVLDVMMPEVNGFQACKKFREFTNVPIIFLTGVTSEEEKIKGFMLGADDYLEKPYSLRELNIRIIANIRRNQSYSKTISVLNFPPLSINIEEHKAYYNNEEIPLSNREYELLYLLVSNANDLVSFKDIGIKMWGAYLDADRRSVMVTVSRLRKKFENMKDLESMIETVWSKGYTFRYHERKVENEKE